MSASRTFVRLALPSVSGLVLGLCASCSGPEDPEVRERDAGEFEVSRRLNGHEIRESSHGPWQTRKIEHPMERGFDGREALGVTKSMAEGETSSREAKTMTPASPDGAGGGIAPREEGHMANEFQGSPLRAGSTDDNADFEKYLEYLAEQRANGTLEQALDIDVADRLLPRVLDEEGRPLPGARVTVLDEEKDLIAYRGTTYGDGRFPFYPRLLEDERLTAQSENGGSNTPFLVEVRWNDASQRFRWDGRKETDFQLTGVDGSKERAIQLDVVFVIDTTGSMGDEIARIKASLLSVTKKLRSLALEFDLRYGAVLYRDLGDEYVTRSHPFTGDIEAFDRALQDVQAGGGGDTPESLNQGLAVCVSDMEWRKDAARVAFLIADAPPHLDYEGDVSYDRSLKEAVAKGIRIHAVAASGLDDVGSLVFRQVAQFTRGKFVFIEYGSPAASAADHGVTGSVESNNLDDILFEQLRDELARYGRL